MALFEGYRPKANSRTDMRRFFVSEGISPHEEWLLDEQLPVLFSNPFGKPGQTEVVIGKGMACAVKPTLAKSFDYGTDLAVITLADGNNAFIGPAPYNLCRGRIDRFEGNKPNILRRQYVEIPWFRRSEDAAQVNYGCCFGDIKPGDVLKVTKQILTVNGRNMLLGKYDKYDKANDDYWQVLGQIMGIEMDVEPWGWFKWVMWDEVAKRQDDVYINYGGKDVQPDTRQTPNGGDYGFPFDPEYREGRFDINGYLSQYTRFPTGIPGLTDGENRRYQNHEATIPGGTTAGTNIQWTLPYKAIVQGSVKVTVGSTLMDPSTYVVDHDLGVVTFTAPQDYVGVTPVLVEFEKLFPGTPTSWDTKGFTGMVRLLLR